MTRSTVKKYATLLTAMLILALEMNGGWLMWNAIQQENIDNDRFMWALALMMTAVTLWLPLQSTLVAVTQSIKERKTKKVTPESLIERTGKMLVFKEGAV